jgi:hypothetical protein
LAERAPGAHLPLPKRLCPHCGDSHTCRWGRSRSSQRYRCRQCGRTFNALTGTRYARLRSAELWLDYRAAIAAQLSVRRAADRFGISAATALRWRSRIGLPPGAAVDGDVGRGARKRKRASRQESSPPQDAPSGRAVDFVEWARAAIALEDEGSMRERINGLFGAATQDVHPARSGDTGHE